MSGPLTGRRVLVTRPIDRAGELKAALEAAGAGVMVHPLVEVVRPDDPGPLEEAARALDRYDWLAFTSVYGVRALAQARSRTGTGDAGGGGAGAGGAGGGGTGVSGRKGGRGAPDRLRIACVGRATAEAAAASGWPPDVVPEHATAEGLADALLGAISSGARVLFPRGEDARETLPARLRAAGVIVDDVIAYRKVLPATGHARLAASLAAGEIDALTFTSPSIARTFVQQFGSTAAAGCRVVVIGPTTAAAVRELGLPAPIVAPEATVDGLVQAVIMAFH